MALPAPATQNASGGVSGLFNLYYYVANFNLNFTEVAVENGEFVLPKGELNQQGELHNPQKLLQFLRIETTVAPSKLSYAEFDSSVGAIKVQFSLQAFQDAVTVFFPTEVGSLSLPVIFKNIKTDKFFVLESIIGFNEIRTSQILVRAVPMKREVFVVLRPELLPPGDYEVIPYLLLRHETIPQELINSLGENATAFRA